MRSFLAKQYYKKWVAEIAHSDKITDLEQHFVKHANELIVDDRNPESWAASMRTLLDIYEKKHNIHPDIELQLTRMVEHSEKYPDTRVGVPGGKLPWYVKKSSVPKFKE